MIDAIRFSSALVGTVAARLLLPPHGLSLQLHEPESPLVPQQWESRHQVNVSSSSSSYASCLSSTKPPLNSLNEKKSSMIHRIISIIRCTTLSSSMSSRRRRSSGCCSISATGSQLGRTHPTNCRGRDVARREAFRLSTLMMESSLEFRRCL